MFVANKQLDDFTDGIFKLQLFHKLMKTRFKIFDNREFLVLLESIRDTHPHTFFYSFNKQQQDLVLQYVILGSASVMPEKIAFKSKKKWNCADTVRKLFNLVLKKV